MEESTKKHICNKVLNELVLSGLSAEEQADIAGEVFAALLSTAAKERGKTGKEYNQYVSAALNLLSAVLIHPPK